MKTFSVKFVIKIMPSCMYMLIKEYQKTVVKITTIFIIRDNNIKYCT